MKIPGLKEKRKKQKTQPQATIETRDIMGNDNTYVTPPSYKEILKEGRNWTHQEIIQIITLQTALQGRSIGLWARDFEALWDKSNKRCAITNAPFEIGSNFNIGIELINARAKYHPSNYRLMLLPFSYSKRHINRLNIKNNNFHNKFCNRPISKSLLQSCRKAITTSRLSKLYPIFVSCTELIDNTRLTIKGLRYSHFSRSRDTISFYAVIFGNNSNKRNYYLDQYDGTNGASKIDLGTVEVNDEDLTLDIVCGRERSKLSLNDPSIDYAKEALSIIEPFARIQLECAAYSILNEDYKLVYGRY